MYSDDEIREYLDEIRAQVCTHCVERPRGGPPCAPLGKRCGLEINLPSYLDAVHEVDSPSIGSYLESLHRRVCSGCAQLHCEGCPCPLDYLHVLIVQAIETVDQRRSRKACAQPT
jgi:hypothetical protein